MFNKAALMWIYAEHPVHAGSGTGVGAIDLPIQRENVTNWPIIQPSGLKGALREHFESREKHLVLSDPTYKEKIDEVFGPEAGADHAGAIALTDAKLLLVPVCSLKGTFAYITCPLAISRLRRDLLALRQQINKDLLSAATDSDIPALPDINASPKEDEIWVAAAPQQAANDPLVNQSDLAINNEVILNELSFKAKPNPKVNEFSKWIGARTSDLSWLEDKDNIFKRLAIVHDNTFKFFVETYTEVVTRNKINNDTGIVEPGALWAEEYLPRESVLYSTVFAVKPFKNSPILVSGGDVLNFVTKAPHVPKYLWVGGNITTGKGLVKLQFI